MFMAVEHSSAWYSDALPGSQQIIKICGPLLKYIVRGQVHHSFPSEEFSLTKNQSCVSWQI
jgi:hypothetical protein